MAVKAMAICGHCDQEMTERVGCTLPVFDDFADGLTRRRVKFRGTPGYRTCGDCGVPTNSFHHPGCDMERCPSCKRQAMSCGCLEEEDEEDEDHGFDWSAAG